MSTDRERLAAQERRLYDAMTVSLQASADAIRPGWSALADLLEAATPIHDEASRVFAVTVLELAMSTVRRFTSFVAEFDVQELAA